MNAAASMQRRGFMKRMAAAGGGLLIGVPGAAQAQSRNRTEIGRAHV